MLFLNETIVLPVVLSNKSNIELEGSATGWQLCHCQGKCNVVHAFYIFIGSEDCNIYNSYNDGDVFGSAFRNSLI